jgi:Zn ribbon nucleic-acid-binding protein
MTRATSILPWVLIAFAAGAWFLAAFRIMHRLGAAEAAVAAGLLVALAVATMLWRWAEHDRTRRSLAAGRCPGCSSVLSAEHEHARTGGGGGVQVWECRQCGYRRSEPLTCEHCPP